MSGVNTILENAGARLGKDFTGKKDERPVQQFTTIKEIAVEVGRNPLRYLLQKKGRFFRMGFVGPNNRPMELNASGEELLASREDVIAAVNAAFDGIEADQAAFKAKRPAGNAPVEVRHTGKTERERLKKQGKLKA